ncbi:hypothetical protein GCM10017744_007700 [Streptomyces antimycoticus]
MARGSSRSRSRALRRRATVRAAAVLLLCGAAVPSCASTSEHRPDRAKSASARQSALEAAAAAKAAAKKKAALARLLPGMPPPLDPHDLYAADRPGKLSRAVKHFPSRVYVPNTLSDTVSVIDPKKFKVVRTIQVGHQPQHVVPSWDLKTLWVNNDLGNTLTPIDPASGRVGRPVDVHDPYNLYFTPDGKYAVVMASMDRALVFRDAHTMKVVKSVPANCYGVNHADFSPDGRYFIVSCEFSGELLKVDTAKKKVVAKQRLPIAGAMPQDVKISPDGKTWYIADMVANGLWVLNGDTFGKPKLLPTERARTAST